LLCSVSFFVLLLCLVGVTSARIDDFPKISSICDQGGAVGGSSEWLRVELDQEVNGRREGDAMQENRSLFLFEYRTPAAQ